METELYKRIKYLLDSKQVFSFFVVFTATIKGIIKIPYGGIKLLERSFSGRAEGEKKKEKETKR